jgi:hypothetical protein
MASVNSPYSSALRHWVLDSTDMCMRTFFDSRSWVCSPHLRLLVIGLFTMTILHICPSCTSSVKCRDLPPCSRTLIRCMAQRGGCSLLPPLSVVVDVRSRQAPLMARMNEAMFLLRHRPPAANHLMASRRISPHMLFAIFCGAGSSGISVQRISVHIQRRLVTRFGR